MGMSICFIFLVFGCIIRLMSSLIVYRGDNEVNFIIKMVKLILNVWD